MRWPTGPPHPARPGCRRYPRPRRAAARRTSRSPRRRLADESRRRTPPSDPCCPAGTRPSARSRSASDTVSRAMSRCHRVPKSSATRSTPVSITSSDASTARASTAEARSLSITASAPLRPPSRRTTGIPPPPAAITSTPARASIAICSNSTISCGLGLARPCASRGRRRALRSASAGGPPRVALVVEEPADRLGRRRRMTGRRRRRGPGSGSSRSATPDRRPRSRVCSR